MADPLRPPVKWHGGKHYLCHRIIALFAAHNTYVEPFGGAASVLLNKAPAQVEVYNDLDHRITRLFRVIRDHGTEFQRRLSLTPYSEVEWKACTEDEGDDIERARQDFVRWRQSVGGRDESFSFTKHRVRRGMADVVSGYLSAIDEVLPQVVERFRSVQILERDAFEVIRNWDGPDTLMYCDLPYVHATRSPSARKIYGAEMSEEHHRDLARLLNSCKSKVVLSGYPSTVYDGLFTGWRKLEFDMPNHSSGGQVKERTVETVWLNWEDLPARSSNRLFSE